MTSKRSVSGSVDFKIDPLLKFQRTIGELKGSQIHIGVLGSKAGARADDSGKTNAEIGAKHEYGSKAERIPRRSFLEMPMVLHFGKALQAKAVELLEIMAGSGAQGFLRGTAIVAEQTVDKAFETGGWGLWPPNSPITIATKKSVKPLIDLGFLRASIASRIVKVGT